MNWGLGIGDDWVKQERSLRFSKLEYQSCIYQRKAEGRRQEAEGNAASRPEACDRTELGSKTPPSTRRL
ncbi:hypothetical protein [Nostoc sp.]|uniref:hypothetical protein n=1 Tax=Nostoc sp. TaxID=1180 RepID=UPI002FF8265F